MSERILYIRAALARRGFDLDIDIDLPLTGTTALFGPSGSGKTTILSLIAGLIRPDSGLIRYDNTIWYEGKDRVPPHKRPVGYLFQSGRLFPHLSVARNLAFADDRADKTKRPYDLNDIITATGIRTLLSRKTPTLSGGEAQRVALARTLLTGPELLLFDEPLSALDQRAKAGLLPLLEDLPKHFNIPCLYVSHDVNEVSRLADHLIMIETGRVKAQGPTETVLSDAGFAPGRNPFEPVSVLQGTVTKLLPEQKLADIRIEGQTLWLPIRAGLSPDTPVDIRIPTRDVALSLTTPEGLSIRNRLRGKITAIEYSDSSAFCTVYSDISGQTLAARITRHAAEDLDLMVGQDVYALIKSAGFEL